MIEIPYMLEALTVDGSGDPGEKTFTADVAAPTAVSDANVWDVQKSQGGQSLEVATHWQIKGRFTGASAAAEVVTIVLYCWDKTAGKFFPSAKLALTGSDGLADDQGNILDMTGVLGTTHVGISLVGLSASHELHLIHRHG